MRRTTGIKSISVQCGSSFGKNSVFHDAATELGWMLASAGIRLIYGGVRTGLMGILAESAIKHEGQVVGVVPRFLKDQGLAQEGLSELIVVESMHERKDLMLELADATIILPGGVGTQDEFWEVLTAAQLGFHAKPCGLLNTEGYYDSLLAFIDRAVEEGFFPADERSNIVVAKEPEQLIAELTGRVISSERKAYT